MIFIPENFLVLESDCVDGLLTNTTQISKVIAKIVWSLDPSLHVHVKEAKIFKEILDRLKDLYEKRIHKKNLPTLLSNFIKIKKLFVYGRVRQPSSRNIPEIRSDRTQTRNIIGLAGLSEEFALMVMALEHSWIYILVEMIKPKLLDM